MLTVRPHLPNWWNMRDSKQSIPSRPRTPGDFCVDPLLCCYDIWGAYPMAANTAIDTLLRAYPEDVQILVRQARKTLREWLPNAGEGVDASARMVAYRYGPGYKGMVCTLILSKSGVKLGIVGGAALADPHELLAGSGKVHRHVQLRTVRDLQQAGLKQLVLGASAACRKRLDEAPEKS
jgi:hypothetical protein